MKIRRYKKVNKNISFFVNNFGFRQPYQILVDGTFCVAALNNKINIADNIPRYLQGEVKLLTTPCAIIEMEHLDKKLNGALLILKKYVIHSCSHQNKPITGSKCLMSMVGNKNENHYIIATQDRDLQEQLREIPGVPLIYLHLKTPVFEEPSEASLIFAKKKLSGIGQKEVEALQEFKKQSGIISEESKPHKKTKGPNPLSCKKKKSKLQSINKQKIHTQTEKRKRKRMRFPSHLKEILKNIEK